MNIPNNKSKSLVETTTQGIIDYITDRKMEPGDKLPTETEFLEIFEVSRGTLREAFKILVARNVLEIRQGSGTFISPNKGIPDDPLGLTFIYDDHTLALDLLDVRLMLEPKIAQLAAINATDEQKERMEVLTQRLTECINNGTSYADVDTEFHQLVAEASGNRVLSNISYILISSIQKNIAITLDVQKISNTLHYHTRILNDIINADAVGAFYDMTMHLNLLREFMVNKLHEKQNSSKQENTLKKY